MDRHAGERTAGRSQGDSQRLAFAGGHFSQAASEHDAGTDQLHVKRAAPQGTLAGFTDDRQGFGQQGFRQFGVAQAQADLAYLRAEHCIIQPMKRRFTLPNPGHKLGKGRFAPTLAQGCGQLLQPALQTWQLGPGAAILRVRPPDRSGDWQGRISRHRAGWGVIAGAPLNCLRKTCAIRRYSCVASGA